MEKNSLAARLKAFREAKGLTKYRLAKLSRISQTYIYRLELGEIKNPRRDTLQELAKGLSITLAQLVGETTPSDTWSLVEQSLKAYVPVYAGVEDMEPIDFVACTRAKVPVDTVRGYRIQGLCLEPCVREGDVIIVDSVMAPVSGDLVMVSTKGNQEEVGIAQYWEDNGSKWLSDEKGKHEVDDLVIHGTITECIHRFRQ